MLFVFYFDPNGTTLKQPPYTVFRATNGPEKKDGEKGKERMGVGVYAAYAAAKSAYNFAKGEAVSAKSEVKSLLDLDAVDAIYKKADENVAEAARKDAERDAAREARRAQERAASSAPPSAPQPASPRPPRPHGPHGPHAQQGPHVAHAPHAQQGPHGPHAPHRSQTPPRASAASASRPRDPVPAIPIMSRGNDQLPLAVEGTPPLDRILHLPSGIARRGGTDPTAKLMTGQWLAARLITGLKTAHPVPIRSALVFHAMGSGKTIIVHALLNYLAGVASRAGKSLACTVVLVWQNEDARLRNEDFIRKNKFDVFAAVKPEDKARIHRNLKFCSIGGTGREDVLDALQIMSSRSARVLIDQLKKKNKAGTSHAEAGTKLSDARHTLAGFRTESRNSREGSGRNPSRIAKDIEEAELNVKTLAEKHKREGEASATRVHIAHAACAPANRALFVVDEVHELLREDNAEMYYALLTAVFHGHARVVLMSGTPVSCESPITDVARLLLLVGGLPFFQWILAGSKSKQAPDMRVSVGRMTYAAMYELTTPAYNKTARYRGVMTNPSQETIRAIQADAAVKLDQMKASLRDVEAMMVGILTVHTDAQRLGAVLDRMCEHDSIAVSYYGRMNGNLAEYGANREDFASYDYSDVARAAKAALKQPVVEAGVLRMLAEEGGLQPVLDGLPDGTRIVRVGDEHAYEGTPVRVVAPKFTQSNARHLVVTVPPYTAHPARAAKMAAHELIGDVCAAEVAAWLTDNMQMSQAWADASASSREAEVVRNYGRYALAWALCVARVVAYAATRSTIDQQKASAVVLMVDRHSYGKLNKGGKGVAMSREEMELIVHLVLGDNNHAVFRKAGLRETQERRYRLAFDSTLGSIAEADADDDDETEFGTSVDGGPSGPPRLRPRRLARRREPREPDARREPREPDARRARREPSEPSAARIAEAADEPVAHIEGFDMDKARAHARGRFGKASDEETSTPRGIEMLVQDMWTEAGGAITLAVEGYDYPAYDGLIVLGLPLDIAATKARQLISRIDRVSVAASRGKKRRRFVAFIREPSMQAVESIGGTDSDLRVDAIERALVRAALDCANNVKAAEASSFECSTDTRQPMRLFV